MGELFQFVLVVGNGPLAPVGAAQAVVTVQVFTLFMQIILPAGVGRVIDQQTILEVRCLIDAVLQGAGVKGHIGVNGFGYLLGKRILHFCKACVHIRLQAGP